jgi:mannose-6-phosphate isomerase
MRPKLLRPDNFTPATRTPWGGRWILGDLKRGLGMSRADGRVGESWEISVEPDFPSRLTSSSELLDEAIERDPVGWLGAAVAQRFAGQTPLLVKIVDAGDNLSVQVHPAPSDPSLGPGESAKTEAWLVLRSDVGAGIWLGFRDGVGRPEVERRLRADGPFDELMNFVPTAPGDVFLLPPGTPHALGAGVTVLEPQHVMPRCRGMTYRFWDWNRRYDDGGRISALGAPRTLHVDRSLAATDWAGPRGEAFVASRRQRPMVAHGSALGRDVLIECESFVVEQWRGTGTLELPPLGTMLGICCLAGKATVRCEADELQIERGQSLVVPAACARLIVDGSAVDLVVTRSP